MGDQMPDRGVIHLPSSLTKVQVYQKMHTEMKSRGKEHVVSQSQFFNLWKEEFGNVSIPKVIDFMHVIAITEIMLLTQENRFTKCDICSMVKKELEKTIDRNKREKLKMLLEEHNKLQM